MAYVPGSHTLCNGVISFEAEKSIELEVNHG